MASCRFTFAISKIIDNIDAVILTHYHIDHFDEFAVQALPKDLKIYVQDDIDKQLLINHDFTNIEVLTKKAIHLMISNSIKLIVNMV